MKKVRFWAVLDISLMSVDTITAPEVFWARS